MDRTKLSLDFNQPRKVPKFGFSGGNIIPGSTSAAGGTTNRISTPDFAGALIKLTSPDVDRIFLPLTPIPTPVYLSNPNISDTNQEAYTKGFVDAFLELHRQQVAKVWGSTTTVIPSLVALTPVSPYKPPFEVDSSEANDSSPINLTTTDRKAPNEPKSTTATPDDDKEFPITTTSLVTTPLISPSTCVSSTLCNLTLGTSTGEPCPTFKSTGSDQEKAERELARLARRREKNRNAARKCRTKKLERIASLEEQVRRLKQENSQLSAVLDKHKKDVYNLQKDLSDHINNKNCKLFPNGKSRH